MGKRGQVTIYIIIAILVVAAIALVYLFYPKITSVVSGDFSPGNFIEDRLEEPVQTNKETLSVQGGYNEPEGFIMYNNNKIEYLCYTSEYYKPCHVQQPMIKQNFEKELAKLLQPDAELAINELKMQYERRGYSVVGGDNVKTSVEIVPNKIKVKIDSPLTVTLKDTTQTFDDFEVEYDSQMYFLLMTATSITDYESTYGNTDTSLYIRYYPNLLIEKNKLEDGSTIYSVEDVTTKERFTFASRSLAWPAGLGLTENG